jgi:hypothetical protein
MINTYCPAQLLSCLQECGKWPAQYMGWAGWESRCCICGSVVVQHRALNVLEVVSL